MFRPLVRRTVRWRPAEGEGLEHLTVEALGDGRIEARSVVVGERGGSPYGASYRIRCDAGWRVAGFEVGDATGRRLAMTSPEPGRWQDAEGRARAEFDGCIDIDLSATPFTNTLPIRRLELTEAQGAIELAMLYVPFDTLEPIRDAQRYSAIEDGRLCRYEASDRSFVAELPLDADGLVTDYPTLFRRL
ncbi:putative glycolipid-binding domain-containing protein [Aureimonas leprariae]|uniref:Transcriptional regulator n=1 Tax=Plantimonas leprariae TaxID=2615207 RepID=A0A7V7PMJ5_9HYPH|nr:putative glycolipid-binding domain-containing protein [Aureimonas leprariae]KAB0678122.1 transcriptional regulator [Aureimonas leprariae]